MKKSASRSVGQALLLVMWALFVMSFAILGLIKLLQITMGTASALERVSIVSALAAGGVVLGRNADFPLTGKPEVQKFDDGRTLEVVAVSENGRLNINKALADQNRDTLRRLFRGWGLSDVEADTVIDCLLDYVEPGQNRRLNGAKRPQYRAAGRPGLPPGRPFRSIDEMKSVLHFDYVMDRKPNWREYFTIYGDGNLDLLSAPPDLIKAFCGIGDSAVKAVMRMRNSDVTPPAGDLEKVRAAMGMTESEFAGFSGKLSMGGDIRRIRASATFAQTKRTVEAICKIGNGKFTVLEWREW